jgi:ribonuclease HI
VSETTLAKYPGWAPKRCLNCSKRERAPSPTRSARPRQARSGASTREQNLTVAEVLEKYTAGPKSGIFTDGAAEPNPGPGGWGVVHVQDDRIVGERCGHEPHTTNNRMELVALIAGCALLPKGTPAVLYTDSQLCVSTITEWAETWEARGWKRKRGEIKNLELVQELYASFKSRPELELRWIPAHSGHRWNEYADALATAYRRSTR